MPIRANLRPQTFDPGMYPMAREIFDHVTTTDDFVEFLTLPASEYLP
jgi:hypothetical protein